MIQYVAQSDIAILLFIAVLSTLVVVWQIIARLGLYSIAKRRGTKHPWLVWLPIGKGYILGCISDQYQAMHFGRQRSRRRLLLVLDCVYPIITAVIVTCAVMLLLYFAIGLFTIGLIFLSEDVQKQFEIFAVLLVAFSLCSVPIYAFRLQALYDLYRSCNPGAAKVFLVLSIIFSVAEPFFIFLCRNMDDGMPMVPGSSDLRRRR